MLPMLNLPLTFPPLFLSRSVTNLGQWLYIYSICFIYVCITNWNLTNTSWPRRPCWPRDAASLIHSYIVAGETKAAYAIHLLPFTRHTSHAQHFRLVTTQVGEATSIKALPVAPNWIYATFMCRCKFVELRRSSARLDSTHLCAARAKNEERNERHLESGAKAVGGEFGGVAATNSMRVQTRQDSNNCKLLPLLLHTTFEDFKWNYAKTFRPNFLKRSATGMRWGTRRWMGPAFDWQLAFLLRLRLTHTHTPAGEQLAT